MWIVYQSSIFNHIHLLQILAGHLLKQTHGKVACFTNTYLKIPHFFIPGLGLPTNRGVQAVFPHHQHTFWRIGSIKAILPETHGYYEARKFVNLYLPSGLLRNLTNPECPGLDFTQSPVKAA